VCSLQWSARATFSQSTQRIACVIPLLLLGSSIASAGSRARTDIVYMKNGDRITCEVKSLAYGQLSVKPDYILDTVVLDWSKVEHIESSQVFSVLIRMELNTLESWWRIAPLEVSYYPS
jgi:hypothetical protein